MFEGNPLFILQEFTSLESIECDISLNSLKPEPMSEPKTDSINPSVISSPDYSPNITDSTTKDEYTRINRRFVKKSSGGLNGGAIAAIIICILVALAIFGIVFALKRKNVLNSNKINKGFETSISNLKIDK